MTARTPAVKRLLSSIALAFGSVFVGLALAEAIVRVFDLGPQFQVVFRDSVQPSADPVLGYELRPGGRDGALRISSAGLRDAEVPQAKPAGVFRIAAIGDSITYGSGVRREQGWPDRLEERLNALAPPGAPRFEVLNLGVPGYNITQVVERLRVLGLAFDPDLVIYAYALNDPQSYSLEALALRELRANAEGRSRDTPAFERWLAQSRLFLWARHALLPAPPAIPLRVDQLPRDPAYGASAGSERAAFFRALHADAESHQRMERGFADLAALTRPRALPALVATFPLFAEHAGEDPLLDVHRQVGDAARAEGLAVLDLRPVYEAARPAVEGALHVDFLHPNGVGQRVAVAALVEWLCVGQLLPAGALDCARRTTGDDLDARLARAIGSPAAP